MRINMEQKTMDMLCPYGRYLVLSYKLNNKKFSSHIAKFQTQINVEWNNNNRFGFVTNVFLKTYPASGYD